MNTLDLRGEASTTAWVPNTSISVYMYELDYDTGASTGILCSAGNGNLLRYGCTFFDFAHYGQSAVPYPYATNPASVNIEGDYLLDVLSAEMEPADYTHSTAALQAQAIASRSFAHWHIENWQSTIENSTGFQVFIPYKYESMSANAQQRARDAVSLRYYLSDNSTDSPARADFGADSVLQTVSDTSGNPRPYLVGVEDPISNLNCDASNGPPGSPYHRRGLSQRGANRWLNGNQCYLGNSPWLPWGVRWSRVEQVVFHYFTNVHLRNLDTRNIIASSVTYSWNLLQINWGAAGNLPVWMRTRCG